MSGFEFFFSMNLNTAVLKGVFVHFLLQFNESNRESSRKPVAGFFSEVTHLRALLFFYSREALCGDGECYKSDRRGTSASDAPGELCEELQFPSVGSISLADWFVFHLLV